MEGSLLSKKDKSKGPLVVFLRHSVSEKMLMIVMKKRIIS